MGPVDALTLLPFTKLKVHEHGYVELVDVMPRLVDPDRLCEQAVVEAARVSYGKTVSSLSDDRRLLRYLFEHRHTTPFEMVEIKWRVKAPIFVMRQWIRHRTANVNEISGRYQELPDERFEFTPPDVRSQSSTNKQGRVFPADDVDKPYILDELDKWNELADAADKQYRKLLELGVSREQARIHLPLSTYTEFVWKNDLHNLLNFFSLRADQHAQLEIQQYAETMLRIITPLIPTVIIAWETYRRYSQSFSVDEQQVVKHVLYRLLVERDSEHANKPIPISASPWLTKRQVTALVDKLTRLGLPVELES